MNDYLEEAQDELKRVDHIIFVSLKYTRTVDVIRNALHRLLSAFNNIIDGILYHAHERKTLPSVPSHPKSKIRALSELYAGDAILTHYLSFYEFLRELIKAKYDKREEYRRHVTMVTHLSHCTAEVTINTLEDCFDKEGRLFLEYAKKLTGASTSDE